MQAGMGQYVKKIGLSWVTTDELNGKRKKKAVVLSWWVGVMTS